MVFMVLLYWESQFYQQPRHPQTPPDNPSVRVSRPWVLTEWLTTIISDSRESGVDLERSDFPSPSHTDTWLGYFQNNIFLISHRHPHHAEMAVEIQWVRADSPELQCQTRRRRRLATLWFTKNLTGCWRKKTNQGTASCSPWRTVRVITSQVRDLRLTTTNHQESDSFQLLVYDYLPTELGRICVYELCILYSIVWLFSVLQTR